MNSTFLKISYYYHNIFILITLNFDHQRPIEIVSSFSIGYVLYYAKSFTHRSHNSSTSSFLKYASVFYTRTHANKNLRCTNMLRFRHKELFLIVVHWKELFNFSDISTVHRYISISSVVVKCHLVSYYSQFQIQ